MSKTKRKAALIFFLFSFLLPSNSELGVGCEEKKKKMKSTSGNIKNNNNKITFKKDDF